MATRQYIGARYVPKFYDYNGSPNWREGVEYENLTIVTRNGNSYTSKKPVPSDIGEPENNPEYWAATGLYNEQIENYRQEVAEYSALTQDVLDSLAPLTDFTNGVKTYDVNGKKLITEIGKTASYQFEKTYSAKSIALSGNSDYTNLQGCCYNSRSNSVIVAFTDSLYESAILVALSLDLKTVYNRSNPLPIGHANALSYKPSTNSILCACGVTGSNANKIVEIDASSYTITSTHNTEGTKAWYVAYDNRNDVIYYGDYHTLVICDNSFNIITTVATDILLNDSTLVSQGCFCKNGTLYIIWTTAENSYYFSYYDLNTGKIEKYYEMQKANNHVEPEDGFVVDDKIYIIFGQNIATLNVYSDADSSMSLAPTFFSSGERIPENANLNDYMSSSKYFCASGDVARTIQNYPVNTYSGFSLYVATNAFNHIIQILVSNGGQIYYRFYLGSYGESVNWSDWSQVVLSSGSVDYISPNNYCVRISHYGSIVCVSGCLFGKGTTGYLGDITLPTPFNGGSVDYNTAAVIFHAREQTTGNVLQLRCGGLPMRIYLQSNMTDGVQYAFSFAYNSN